LRVVRTLASNDELTCQEILPDMTKSSASHHWRMLRESGIVEQRREGRYLYLRLRKADLDTRFPGLLDAVIKG
jgi:DNA-binding transcriptional ArsR family regulator